MDWVFIQMAMASMLRESTTVYARLLNEKGAPIEVATSAVFEIAQQPSKYFPWSIGSHVQVVGGVPVAFEHLPDMDKVYKVALRNPDTQMQQWVQQSMALPACSIDIINIEVVMEQLNPPTGFA